MTKFQLNVAFIKTILLLNIAFFSTNIIVAQKKEIDNNSFRSWATLKEIDRNVSSIISNDGKYVAYKYEILSSGEFLVVQSIDGKYKRSFQRVNHVEFTEDSRKIVFITQEDSLKIITLGSSDQISMGHVKSFVLPKDVNAKSIIYQLDGANKDLVVLDLVTSDRTIFSHVNEFVLGNHTKILALSIDTALILHDLSTGYDKRIMTGSTPKNLVFDRSSKRLAFLASGIKGTEVYYFKEGMGTAEAIINNHTAGMPKGCTVSIGKIHFSEDAERIYFEVTDTTDNKSERNVVKESSNRVWSSDDKYLSPDSYQEGERLIVVSTVVSPQIILLNTKMERPLLSFGSKLSNDFVLTVNVTNTNEFYWNGELLTLKIINIHNGLARKIKQFTKKTVDPFISPMGKYVCWFDYDSKCYYSYEVSTCLIRNISKKVKYPLYNVNSDKIGSQLPFGILGWLDNDESLLIYDQFDIWKVDPLNEDCPVNLTKEFGRFSSVVFRDVGDWSENKIVGNSSIVAGLDLNSKFNGFWRVNLKGQSLPKKLTMGPYCYYTVKFAGLGTQFSEDIFQKAKWKNLYVVRRMSASESPNLFLTNNFVTFKELTDIHPEKEYNWLTTELVRWTLPDGRRSMGILYKPQNFDSTQSYPIIFHYYEKKSEELYFFKNPELSYGDLSIPWYVSNGYLVFVPDMQYEPGNNAQSITNTITSAVERLRSYPFININKMGLQGHSFGGYETLVLITRTNLFKAAQESAGPSNLISGYSFLSDNKSQQEMYEYGQINQGVSLYENPNIYRINSPIFYARNVTTPLLIMHNRRDDGVSFTQATEFFIALRRLKKTAWLLEYENEGHGLLEESNQLDFNLKQQQFFDYYLKDKDIPNWMR